LIFKLNHNLIIPGSIVLTFTEKPIENVVDTSLHVFCWKRYLSLKRTIESLNLDNNLRLSLNFIVNIDGGHSLKVVEYTKTIKWDAGKRIIRIRQENIGIPQVRL
jgi:hypothetical protein